MVWGADCSRLQKVGFQKNVGVIEGGKDLYGRNDGQCAGKIQKAPLERLGSPARCHRARACIRRPREQGNRRYDSLSCPYSCPSRTVNERRLRVA